MESQENADEPKSETKPTPPPPTITTPNAPSLKTLKQIVLGVAVVLFLLSCIKAYRDNRDKEFLKVALTSTLNPTNRYFNKIEEEITWEADKRLLDSRNCNHSQDGISCFFWSQKDTSKQATLVFDRVDMAEIYAAVIRRGHDRDLIKDHFDKTYKLPTEKEDPWDEDFVDKVGLLSTGICFSKNKDWDGAKYNYNSVWESICFAVARKRTFRQNN